MELLGGGYIEDIGHLTQKCSKMAFGICQEKNIFAQKINFKLVNANVFNLRNEFNVNRKDFEIL